MSKVLSLALANDDVCPRCLGVLSSEVGKEWVCMTCGFDAFPLILDESMLPALSDEERRAMESFDINDLLDEIKRLFRDGEDPA